MKLQKIKHFSLVVGLLAVACLVATILIALVSMELERSPLEVLDNALTDVAIQGRKTTHQDSAISYQDLVIVDIDDASIERLGRVQLWPRAYDAAVTEYIASGNPRSIGFDILYTERDTLTPTYKELLEAKGFRDADRILRSLSTDDSLANVFARAGNIYLSIFDDDESKRDPSDSLNAFLPPLLGNKENVKNFVMLRYPVLPTPMLREAAKSVGSINMPTSDGVVRKYVTLQQLPSKTKDTLVPLIANFPILIVMSELEVPFRELYVTPGMVHLGKERSIPVNERGEFRINWLGEEEKIRYISYYKLLEHKVPAEFFEGKYVFMGTSAAGLNDLKTTPRGKMPGVEVHAIAFLNIANSSFLQEMNFWAILPILFCLAVMLQAIFYRLSPIFTGLVTVIVLCVELFGFWLYYFPAYQTIIPMSSVLLLTSLSFIGSLIYKYFAEGKERVILKRAFETYVPPDVVSQIMQNTDLLSLGGEKKFLTVLFSDIRGFTSYSETLDPQELVALLNFYLSSMSEVIFRHRGTIDKFIGDAIMAIFGAPVSQQDSCDRACATALDMCIALEAVNKHQQSLGHPHLEIGIGINSGDMTVGNIGSDRRFDYTVIGDAVNLGSRLEGLNKYFGTGIIVSESTKERCTPDRFIFRKIAAVRVKGKDKPIVVYELLDYVQNMSKHEAILNLHNEGLRLFYETEFADAADYFSQLLDIKKSDGLALFYLKLCEKYSESPTLYESVISMDNK